MPTPPQDPETTTPPWPEQQQAVARAIDPDAFDLGPDPDAGTPDARPYRRTASLDAATRLRDAGLLR